MSGPERHSQSAGAGVSDGTPAQLRRRRAASYRCTVLADGRSDPLDPPRPVRPVQVRAVGKYSVEFCGPGVRDGIASLLLRHMRSRTGQGWLVQTHAAEDLMTLLEMRGYKIDVTL